MFLVRETWLVLCLLFSCVPVLSILSQGRKPVLPAPHLSALAKSGVPPRIAVIISGLQDRFLLGSKLEQIVGSGCRTADCWQLDFYIKLLEENNGHNNLKIYGHTTVEPEFQDKVGKPSYEAHLRQRISASGAAVKYLELPHSEEEIDFNSMNCSLHRIKQYPPCKHPAGQNVLRRFFSIQNLATMALQKHNYTFVLVTRDDDHYLGKLDFSRFAKYDNITNRVFSKDCLHNGGVNDKTFVFGLEAAKRTLLRLYSDFWMLDQRLDETVNPEQHLKQFFKITGAISTKVPFGDIPTADSVWVVNKTGAPVLCQKLHYLCDKAPNDGRHKYWQTLDQPDWCPSMRGQHLAWEDAYDAQRT